jgi:hypothetical protein
MAFNGNHIEYPAAYEAATHARIVSNARKTWTKNTPRSEEIIDFLRGYDVQATDGQPSSNSFEAMLESFAHSLFERFGKLSDKQAAIVLKTIDTRAAKKAEREAARAIAAANSKSVGDVKERRLFRLTCERVIEYERPKFSYYDSGIGYIYLCRDDAGNRIVYKGSGEFLAQGDRAVVKATVKSHEVYKGEQQTIISRPAIVSMIEDDPAIVEVNLGRQKEAA